MIQGFHSPQLVPGRRNRSAGSMLSLVALVSVLMTACADPAREPGRSAVGVESAASSIQDDNRTLVIAMRVEPKTFVGTELNPTYVGIAPESPGQLFHAGLTQKDDRSLPQLLLAEEFPQLGTDTWKVFPDGQMETTWRLKGNLTWHDGAPLVAEDFVPAGVISRMVGRRPDVEVLAPDARPVVFRYRSPAPDAAEINWQPLPNHIVGASIAQMDPREAFDTLPYWSMEFVGLGPYRLERWEPGAFITGTAFPGYALGKPKIARVQLVWISDANTTVTNLLSGSVHVTADRSISFEQVPIIRQEWASRGNPGSILLASARVVYVQPQFRPEYARPPAILDVRFRRALAHAIDRQAIVDTVLDGEPGIADAMIGKEEEYYPELDQTMAKHPLDPRRSEQLMADMSFAKDGEGFYAQGGSRLAVNLVPRGDYLREALIVVDGWKRAGIDGPIRTLSAAEAVDQELAAVYPATTITQFGIKPNPFPYFNQTGMASASTRWAGQNKSGYFDSDVQRLSDLYDVSLDRNERNRAVMQGLRILADQAAYFPLYYGYEVVAHSGSVTGPRGGRQDNSMWRVQDWTWK